MKIKLRKGKYTEKTLVNKLCTSAQIESYAKKDKFASGKHQSMFLDTLSRYCEYEYNGENKTYKITKVYKNPKTITQSRLHKGIYQYLAPLILNEMVNHHDENHKARLTVFDLANKIAMVNQNYNYVKFNQEQTGEDLDIPYYIMHEYFNKTDHQIDEFMRRCIKYLTSENCVIANEVYVIQTAEKKAEVDKNTVLITKNKDTHTASDEEMDLYARLLEKASKISSAYTNYDQWYGKNSRKFKRALKQLLDEHGINYVCRGFEMWYVDLEKCEDMLKEFSDISLEDRTKMLGVVFKLMIDENAEKRAKSKSQLNSGYIEHFKSLSALTVLQDSDDIRKYLKSWKSQPERLIEKANGMSIEYRELNNGEDG